MDINSAKILTHVFELEGLMLILEQRDSDTPQAVVDAIKSKARLIANECESLTVPATVNTGSPMPATHDDDDELDRITDIVEGKQDDTVIDAYDDEPPTPTPTPAPTPAQAPTFDVYEKPLTPPAPQRPQAPTSPGAYSATPGYSPIVPPAPHPDEQEFSPIVPQYQAPENEFSPIEPQPVTPPPAPAPMVPPVSVHPANVRMDEKLGAAQAKDLRKAFTLGDTFRFRHELFNDVESEWENMFHMVDGMKSYSQAEDYFYDFLGFDSNNENVKDFMEILRRHFA